MIPGHILERILREGHPDRGGFRIIERRPNEYSSSMQSEVVVVRDEKGSALHLHCKGGIADRDDSDPRQGIRYEARVYRQVLEPSGTTTAHLYGVARDPSDDIFWMVTSWLDGSTRLAQDPRPDSILKAAKWLGRFHRCSKQCSATLPAFLHRHDLDFYLDWARRTRTLWRKRSETPPWLERLCSRFEETATDLFRAPRTVVHGEFFPPNVLVHGDDIVPVDWESAAIAPGAIDLAALTNRWPEEVAERCTRVYLQARFDRESAPADFHRAVELARVYWSFRWLGHSEEWATSGGMRPVLDELEKTAFRGDLL